MSTIVMAERDEVKEDLNTGAVVIPSGPGVLVITVAWNKSLGIRRVDETLDVKVVSGLQTGRPKFGPVPAIRVKPIHTEARHFARSLFVSGIPVPQVIVSASARAKNGEKVTAVQSVRMNSIREKRVRLLLG